MVALNGFDANQVEPSTDFEPVPAGKYLAVITDSDVKHVKSGAGSYLELTFEILESDFKGRKLWARLNLDNPNPTAVKIARGELSAICRAVGVFTPHDSSDLHNLPLVIRVACIKRPDNGEITNDIKGYSAKDGLAGKPVQADAPPWGRN